MGQKDTTRIEHEHLQTPTTFRGRRLDQILEDLNEEETGAGFSEVIRTGVFIDSIIVWTSPAKTLKRTETVFTRTGPFISQVVKKFFADDGSTQFASITVAVTRNANNTIKDVNVTRTRP